MFKLELNRYLPELVSGNLGINCGSIGAVPIIQDLEVTGQLLGGKDLSFEGDPSELNAAVGKTKGEVVVIHCSRKSGHFFALEIDGVLGELYTCLCMEEMGFSRFRKR